MKIKIAGYYMHGEPTEIEIPLPDLAKQMTQEEVAELYLAKCGTEPLPKKEEVPEELDIKGKLFKEDNDIVKKINEIIKYLKARGKEAGIGE